MFSKVFTWVAKAAAVTVAGIAVKEIARRSKRMLEDRRAASANVGADSTDAGRDAGRASDRHRDDGVAEDADRSTQRAPDGTSVVDEWGEESFPASDAPQSW